MSIYLVNGIKLQGTIDSFDQFVVLLNNSVSQMVYKHAISTVVPSRAVRIPAVRTRLTSICVYSRSWLCNPGGVYTATIDRTEILIV